MNYYNYYTEIEEAFIRRRGKNLLLSPLDWALIEGWQDRGIPLHIVLRAVESVFDVFDKQPPGTRAIKSLFYCREEIEAQYSEWLKSQTGKSAESTQDGDDTLSFKSVSEHIKKALTALDHSKNNNLREDFSRARNRLEELNKNLTDNFERVDQTLSDIEKFLDQALLTNADKAHLKNLEKEISTQLKVYKAGMEPDVYQKTFDLMLLKRLREEQEIPRLSLFYL